jgi:hypothetical protein
MASRTSIKMAGSPKPRGDRSDVWLLHLGLVGIATTTGDQEELRPTEKLTRIRASKASKQRVERVDWDPNTEDGSPLLLRQ